MDLTQDDAGAVRHVRIGEPVTVVLAESPTTGYRWQADVDEVALPLTADDYDGATHPAGAAGVRRLTFVPARGGRWLLRLVKRRAWEHKAVAEFEVQLEVAAD